MFISEVAIQGVALWDVTQKFGTPLYIYDAEVICQRFEGLQKALQNQIDIFYSLKANPNISIATILKKQGAGAEVCSLTELTIALAAGFEAKNIIFVGPAKKVEEIEACLEHEIYGIVAESIDEVEMIASLAQAKNKFARVALRINPPFTVKSALLKMGGKPTQFGIDLEYLLQKESKLFSIPNIHLIGIHIYNGTRILEPQDVAENTEKIFELADALQKRWQFKFEFIDIGGGIGVPYFLGEKAFQLQEFHQCMESVMALRKNKYPGTRIILESGRYLVAEAGQMISRIVQIKQSHGETFWITDGGTNCHMAAVGVGSFIKKTFPIDVYTQKVSEKKETVNIAGPLCTPGDLIARQITLDYAEVGDFVAIKSSGAYGPTASPGLFLSHGYPAEVLVLSGETHLIRQRDGVNDLIRKQRICA